MSEKINLHFVSSVSGSIYEISNDLVEPLSGAFNLTRDWTGEIPEKDKRDILLVHFYDEKIIESEHFNSFKKKVLIQPIDGTILKKEVVEGLNKFDLIICPAEASKNIMTYNGVSVPIQVIPNYYKSSMFEKEICTDINKHIPKNKVIFYHESTFHPRKGIELLYEGFIKAFSDTQFADQVVLVVKDQPYCKLTFKRIEELKRQTIKLQKQYEKPAKIIKFSTFLNENELKDLWSAADIYISLAKIEGFGIPMLRMFLMDKPIICLSNQNSGYNDFLSDNNSYMIPTIQHVAKDEFMHIYDPKTSWAIPNINSVILTLRQCLSDYMVGNHKSIRKTIHEDAFSIGKIDDSEKYYKHFSFDNVSNLYIHTLKQLL